LSCGRFARHGFLLHLRPYDYDEPEILPPGSPSIYPPGADGGQALVEDIHGQGITSVPKMADELNRRGILTPRSGEWQPTTVVRLLTRLSVWNGGRMEQVFTAPTVKEANRRADQCWRSRRTFA
jgi:hypothetical protein